jgi:hypothetical protein
MESKIILDQSDPNFAWALDHLEDCWQVQIDGDGNQIFTYGPTGERWVGSDEQWARFPLGPDANSNDAHTQCQYPSAQVSWWNIPTSITVQDYNSQVLTAILISDLDTYSWEFKTKWWEYLLAQYEVSEVSIDVIANSVKDYILGEIYRQEHEVRYLFGFQTYQIAAYFGIDNRTALALQRWVDHALYPSDVFYLKPLVDSGRIGEGGDIRWGLSQLAQHPEGSSYSGDFNLAEIDFQTAFLDFATGGYYSLVVSGVHFTEDAISGDLTIGSFLGVVNVASNLGASGAAALVDIGNDTIGPTLTNIIKGVLMAAGGLLAAASVSGFQITQQLLGSALKFGVATYGVVAAITADHPAVTPPTGTVLTTNQNGQQVLTTLQGVPIDPITGQPITIMPQQAASDGIGVVSIGAAAVAAYMFLK